MEPLNKQERASAIRKFFGMYLLSLGIPLAAAFMFFFSPDSSLKEENEQLRNTVNEMKGLIARMEALNNNTSELRSLDESILQSTDLSRAELENKSQEIETTVKGILYDAKRDTAELRYDVNRQISLNMLRTYDALFTYRTSVASLRKTIEKQGLNASEMEKLNKEIDEYKRKIETYELKILALSNQKGGGGGGGGGGGQEANPKDAQAQIQKCRTELQEKETEMRERKELSMAEGIRWVADTDPSKKLSKRDRDILYKRALEMAEKVARGSRTDAVRKDAEDMVKDIATKTK
jgi:hypothetical protein